MRGIGTNRIHRAGRCLLLLIGGIVAMSVTCGAQTAAPQMTDETRQAYLQIVEDFNHDRYAEVIARVATMPTDEEGVDSLGFTFTTKVEFLGIAGISYYGVGEYQKAIEILLRAEELGKKIPIYGTSIVPEIYHRLVLSLIAVSDYSRALDYALKFERHCVRNLPPQSGYRSLSSELLYRIYSHEGDAAKAYNCLLKSIRVLENIPDYNRENPHYLNLYGELVRLAYNLNLVKEAAELGASLEAYLAQKVPYSARRLNVCNLLFAICTSVNDVDGASEYMDKATEIYDNTPAEKLGSAGQVYLANLCLYMSESDPENAAATLESIVADCRENPEGKRELLATALHQLAEIRGLERPDSPALLGEAFDIFRTVPSADVTSVLLNGTTLVMSLRLNDRRDEMQAAIADINDCLADKVRRTFAAASRGMRAMYWNQVRNWYQVVVPTMAIECGDPRIYRTWYDAMLQSRGILLSSAVSLQRLVNDSKDEELKDLYAQYVALQEIGNTEYLRETLEQKIISVASKYGNYMDEFSADYDRIRSALSPGEIAVEFFKYDPTLFDRTFYGEAEGLADGDTEERYVALLARRDWEMPILVDVCSSADLKEPSLAGLYDAVWRPILDKTGDCRKIYFSPDGELFSLPIEYALTDSGEYLWEQLQCVRLSSTRELVMRRKGSGSNVALFGGMAYDMSMEELRRDAAKYRDVSKEMVCERAGRESLSAVEPLPGALDEVISIERTLKTVPELRTRLQMFKEKRATEAAFKSMSGKHAGIIHVATHGFYEEAGEEETELDPGRWDESGILMQESNDLQHSGLLFAGVDNVRFREGTDSDVEDGVLYAGEIAGLDFSDTDLVVLSACRTGVGKVTGDGVFGLQRGFKQAGVKSILMSLWNVDDEATGKFMSEFYHHLVSDSECAGNKIKALDKAREAVRSVPKWRNDPKYWAGFILLDAI